MKTMKVLFIVATVAGIIGCTAPAPYNQNIDGIVLRGDNAARDIKIRFLSTNPGGACDAMGLEASTDKEGKFKFSQQYTPSILEKYVVAVHPYRLCIFIDSRWQTAWSLTTGPAPSSIAFKCYVDEGNNKIEKCLVSWDKQEYK